VLRRQTGAIEHRIFREIGDYLKPGDLLVLYRTRVIPARLYARKSSGGQVELLLLRKLSADTWECLVGSKGGHQTTAFSWRRSTSKSLKRHLDHSALSNSHGHRRLCHRRACAAPPRIHHPSRCRPLPDCLRRSTWFSPAPTAGLRFTQRLMMRSGGIVLS
jgi:S-adenosylmethionine:tRNA ribosyltransferase-isomerase